MTFRELSVGDLFLWETDVEGASIMQKKDKGYYKVNGWMTFIHPDKRCAAVVKIDPPKEEKR